LNQADKKFLFTIVLALCWWPLTALLLLYFLLLFGKVRVRALKRKIPAGFFGLFLFSALLILKSGAITAGRLRGSLKFNVVCI
jgi:putative effector of murein hydrolase LrgA (UPF0299 family)